MPDYEYEIIFHRRAARRKKDCREGPSLARSIEADRWIRDRARSINFAAIRREVNGASSRSFPMIRQENKDRTISTESFELPRLTNLAIKLIKTRLTLASIFSFVKIYVLRLCPLCLSVARIYSLGRILKFFYSRLAKK